MFSTQMRKTPGPEWDLPIRVPIPKRVRASNFGLICIVPNSDVLKLVFYLFHDGAQSFSYRSRMGIIFCLFWYCTRRLIRLFRNRHCPYQNGYSDALINNRFGTGSAYPRTGRHFVLCLDQRMGTAHTGMVTVTRS